MRILIVGDGKPLVEVEDSIRAVARGLCQQDYAVDIAYDGEGLYLRRLLKRLFSGLQR